MNAVRFHVVFDGSRTLQVPSDVTLSPGPAEVIVLQQSALQSIEAKTPKQSLGERLAEKAKELNLHGLPCDLAENHDFYLHGLPKRNEQA